MKLENQVCSLKLAKRLKELGVKQESLYYWVEKHGEYLLRNINQKGDWDDTNWRKSYSAFTISELGELLPVGFHIDKYKDLFRIGGGQIYLDTDVEPYDFEAKTEANARAKMLIYLLENKLI